MNQFYPSCIRFLLIVFICSGVIFEAQAEKIMLKIKLGGSGSVVVPLEQRERAIEYLVKILDRNVDDDLDDFSAADDPFYPEREPEEQVIIEEIKIVKPQVPKVDLMDVLKNAGDMLSGRIRGTLTAGDNKFLTTDEGSFLGVGSEYPFSFKGEIYNLTIEAVSDRHFTLRFENTRRRISILDAAR